MPLDNAKALQRDGWYFLAAIPGGGAAAVDFERVVETARSTTRAVGGAPRASHWLPTDKGWVGRLWDVTSPEEAVAWLEQFASVLGEGTSIQGRPRKRIAGHNDPRTTLTLGIAFAADLTQVPDAERGHVWAVEDDLTRDLVERAAGWLDLPGAKHYYWHGLWSTPTLGVPPVASLAQVVPDRCNETILTALRTKPVRNRVVDFERQGRVTCQDVDPALGPRDQLALLLECVAWRPDAIDYAFITFDHGGMGNVWTGDYAQYQLPNGLTEPYLRGHRPVLSTRVPDAFGIQVLTDAHLQHAHDLTDWTIEEIAPGRHLVTARDLDPWLVAPGPIHPRNPWRFSPPPAALIDKARADFGDMITSPQQMDELDPYVP